MGALVFAAPALGAPVFSAPVFGALVFVALVFVALRPGTRTTPEAHSPAACSPVCSVASAPPSGSVESADAARRPVGSRRCGHRCPHTFCPLTDTVKC